MQELEQAAEHDAKRLRWDGDDGVDDEEDDTSEELDTGGQPLVVIHTSFIDVGTATIGAPVICRRCICCKVSMDTHLTALSADLNFIYRTSCGDTPPSRNEYVLLWALRQHSCPRLTFPLCVEPCSCLKP